MRKALIFSISLLLIAIGALTSATFIVNRLSGETTQYDLIGESSLSLLQAGVNRQRLLIQLEQAGKYAAHAALLDVVQSGLLVDASCGDHVWNTQDKKCYRTNTVDDVVLVKFREALFAEFTRRGFPPFYDFYLEPPFTIHAIPHEAVLQRIELVASQDTAEEGFRPSAGQSVLAYRQAFSVTIAFDVTVFDKLVQLADSVLEQCTVESEQEQCVSGLVSALQLPTGFRITHLNNQFNLVVDASAYRNPFTDAPLPPLAFRLALPIASTAPSSNPSPNPP